MSLYEKHSMNALAGDSAEDKAYIKGFNHALKLADEQIVDERATSLIAEMLKALEEVQGDLTSGWLEPRSIAMTLCSVRPAILNARKYQKEHKQPHNEASNPRTARGN